MKSPAAFLLALGLATLATLGTGCSEEPIEPAEPEADDRHIWSEQTDTMERARQVEQTLQDAAERQRRALEEMED